MTGNFRQYAIQCLCVMYKILHTKYNNTTHERYVIRSINETLVYHRIHTVQYSAIQYSGEDKGVHITVARGIRSLPVVFCSVTALSFLTPQTSNKYILRSTLKSFGSHPP